MYNAFIYSTTSWLPVFSGNFEQSKQNKKKHHPRLYADRREIVICHWKTLLTWWNLKLFTTRNKGGAPTSMFHSLLYSTKHVKAQKTGLRLVVVVCSCLSVEWDSGMTGRSCRKETRLRQRAQTVLAVWPGLNASWWIRLCAKHNRRKAKSLIWESHAISFCTAPTTPANNTWHATALQYR